MEKIYWITRCDAIHGLLTGLIVISVVCFIVSLVMIFAEPSDTAEVESIKKMRLHGKRTLRCVLVIFPVLCALAVCIPTTNEAYMIYGLGGTIDYLKDNPAAKQLPDKTLQLLNKWEDNQIEQLNKQTEEKKK